MDDLEQQVSPEVKKGDRAARWRKANPEKARAILAKYRENNKEKVHRAHKATIAKFAEKNGFSYATRGIQKIIKTDPIGLMIARQRGGAKARGLEFTITREDLFIPEICPVLKIPFVFERASGKTIE